MATNTSVSLSIVQDTIARALAKFPAERARIERAALLIVLGNVSQVGRDAFEVRSQEYADVTYRVTSDACECQDRQRHPNQSCKHMWAVDILEIAQERQRRQVARLTLSDAELARLVAWKRDHARVTA